MSVKVNIIELRDMVAAAVRQTVAEAKKPKLPAPRSEDSIAAERARRLTGLPGYENGEVLDMSKPLGRKNLAKRQGAANIGGWTSESRLVEGIEDLKREFDKRLSTLLSKHPELKYELHKIAEVVGKIVSSGLPAGHGERGSSKGAHGLVDPASNDLDDPEELGIEQQREAVRHLVRRIVAEEIRVRR